MLAKSQRHDDALLKELTRYGEKYATLCALAYRQTLGALKLVWNSNRSVAWNFVKEISTNGDMQTMDVNFPASPMLLYTEPELLKLLLLPVFPPELINGFAFLRLVCLPGSANSQRVIKRLKSDQWPADS